MTLNEVWSNGFWVISRSSYFLLRQVQETTWSSARTKTGRPAQRSPRVYSTPFTYCAVDYFGPLVIKDRPKELKHYGVLLTCMTSRAIHLETSNSLEADSFINALRQFISRQGPIRQLRTDQATNFMRARKELIEALAEMDQERIIKAKLLEEQCDWFPSKITVPSASHMGGVWERQIRTVCNVLSSLQDNGEQLDDESLRTLICEAEAMVNSRPLTTNQLADPDSPSPLTLIIR